MSEISTVGLDLAKSVFQVHGADEKGATLLRKKLRLDRLHGFFSQLPRCTVAMEACASSHHWARGTQALGHEVRLIPPAYVKPFVKRQKNDMADAEAICEAAQRPTMRFVEPKSAAAQGAAVVFRNRDLLVRLRTQLINTLRGHLGEFGFVVRQGAGHAGKLVELVGDPGSEILEGARPALAVIADMLQTIQSKIALLDREIGKRAKEDATVKRLMTIPGVGPVAATALVALAPPARTFRRGRDFAAWPGLTPKQHSRRRERAARTYYKDGREELASTADPRRQLGNQGSSPRPVSGQRLAVRYAGTQAAHAQHCGIGQQDGEDRLGAHGARRILQSSGCGGVTRQAGGVRDARKVNREVWRNGQKTGSGKPVKCPKALSAQKRCGPDPRSPYRPAAVIRIQGGV